jgi:hypothetical protein
MKHMRLANACRRPAVGYGASGKATATGGLSTRSAPRASETAAAAVRASAESMGIKNRILMRIEIERPKVKGHCADRRAACALTPRDPCGS